MDDDRTNQTLDALGDLYLTGAQPVHVTDEEQHDLADELQGPKPFRLSTRNTAASIFDRDDADYTSRRAVNNAAVQAVFLGHLPGFGGPWLTQYAHDLAHEAGPVAVLHVDHEQIDLELVGTAQQRELVEQLAAAADVPASEGLIAALTALTRPKLPNIGAYLVHLPMPLNEVALSIAPDLPRWTMLCATDQMSTVAAFRWISELTGHPDDGDPARIGLMIMGADEQQAEETALKVNEAASGLVQDPIELIGSIPQMLPVQMKTLGSFEAGAGLWPRLAAFLDAQPGPRDQRPVVETAPPPEPPDTPDTPDTPQTPDSPEPPLRLTEQMPDTQTQAPEIDVLPEPQVIESVVESQPQPEVVQQTPVVEAAPPVEAEPEPEPQPIAETEPEPVAQTPDSVRAFVERLKGAPTAEQPTVVRPEPVTAQVLQEAPDDAPQEAPDDAPQEAAPPAPAAATVVATDQLDLAGFAHVDAIEARCPYHEQVQIAVESDGRMHLLLQMDNPAVGLTLLGQVRTWAAAHARLLQLACPGRAVDAHAAPVMHVFSDNAKAAAALVAHVDPHTRLHLLQSVNVAGQTSWVATELN